MMYLQTYENRQQWRIYGGKDTIWYNPKVGDFYHMYSPNIVNWECTVEVVGIDKRMHTVYYIAVGPDKEVGQLKVPMGSKNYVFHVATKEEIKEFKKITATKRFDL